MKKISTLMLLGLAFGSINAAQISQSEALGVASRYMAGSRQKHLVRAMQTSHSGDAAPYYIFNAADGNGFVIVSGDDELTEVVGYSKTGHIDTSDIPDGLQSLLDSYAAYVAQVQSGEAQAYKVSVADAAPVVAPLLTSTWNQTDPYNRLCPIDPSTNQRSAVGCVATAMAQVCNYWKWPLKPQAFSTSYRCSNGTRVQVDFSKSEYDWDNMLDSYPASGSWTDAQANAVAQLSFDLGAAVYMDYASAGSGAQDSTIPYTLERFGYDCQLYYRSQYTKATFIDLIKENLDMRQPMLFSGQGTAGGHCFVADGYDSNGFIHINWGWAGTSDGYFDVDAMNPSVLGTGGGAGGFNSDQSVVSVIKDSTMTGSAGQLPLTMCPQAYGYNGRVAPSVSELKKGEQVDILVQHIANFAPYHDYSGNFTVGVFDDDFNCVAMSTMKNGQVPGGRILSSELSFPLKEQLKNLADGTYTVWAMSREVDNVHSFDWIRIGYETPLVMTVEGDNIMFGGKLELALASPITADRDVINPGDRVKFTVKLSNEYYSTDNGSLTCELRNEDRDQVIITSRPTVSLGGKSPVEVVVTVSMMKGSVKAGERYSFTVKSFTNGTKTVDILNTEPFLFTAGGSSVETVDADAVAVYPNPTDGIVNVSADGEVIRVEAYSAAGSLVAKVAGTTLDLTGCPAGIYMVRVTTAEGTTVHRVVKK